ncbi:MAG: purine-binding chemotaxis protein CheW [Thermoanaerobaculia bacterium]|jgi:purine-binding chemotaxis protein CheW|nr:purine-binding chemotaxis protein CheW [Thermoanaerobaculia bacterium]
MQTSAVTKSLNQYLTFFLAGEEYALSILQVTDIIECGIVTRVPGTPQWIRGVHNLRGTVVPVIDLAIKFGLPATEITRRTCVVIVELRIDDETLIMGVMADSVHQVVELGPEEIQAAPAFGPRVRADCVLGMAASNGKFIVLLDIDRILATDEILTAVTAGVDDSSQGAEPWLQDLPQHLRVIPE